jgi:hypothetical protein
MAADRETPLTALFAEATRLAYPACGEEDVKLAVSGYERYLADPPRGVDRFGNPLWMRLAPSSGVEEERMREGAALLRTAADRGDEELPAPKPATKHFFQRFFPHSEISVRENIKKSGVEHSFGVAGRNNAPPVRLIRALVFITFFAALYYCFTGRF